MVRLNVIYTRTGDKGETGLGDGSRRPKCDARVAAMGDVDETNCAVGVARLAVRASTDAAVVAIDPTLARIQNDLFDLGADLCLPPDEGEKPDAVLRIAASQVEALELAIDALNANLAPYAPSCCRAARGCRRPASGARRLPARRTQRRRARRARRRTVGETALAYVNRLSDYLFVAARYPNDGGKADVLWAPGANRTEPR